MINADLYRAKRISSNFEIEKDITVKKFSKAGFPRRFTESVNLFILKFINRKYDEKDEMIIPENFFDDPRRSVFVKLPYCTKK